MTRKTNDPGMPVVVSKSMKPMDVSFIRKPNPDSPLSKELYEYMNGVLRAYNGARLMTLLCGGTEAEAEKAGDEAAQLVKDEWDFDAFWERVEKLLTEED